MADFNLGRLKFKWRGDWAINTQYLIDDITKYGGLTYVCIVNHTSGNAIANFYTDIAKWNEHTQGLLVTGAWVASSFYKVNDVFQRGSNQYRVITQHTSPAVFDPTASEIEVLLEGGFEWKGVWNVGTVYIKGQTVRYGGSTYVCVVPAPGTTAGDLPSDNTKFAILTSGLKWRGVWSGATAYLIDDVVNHNESSYVLVVNTDTGTVPGTNPAIWNVVSQGDPQAVLLAQGDLLTRDATQHVRLATGSAGQYLKSDGTDPSWSNLDPDAFPAQTGKDGWILTTDGTNVVWSDVINSAPAALDTLNELAAALADDADFAGTMTTNLATKVAYVDSIGTLADVATPTGQSGKFLKSDGTGTVWASADPDAFPAQATHGTKFLQTDGTNVSWQPTPVEIPAQGAGTAGLVLMSNGTVGQEYWGSVGGVTSAETPPTGVLADPGAFWWKSDTGELYFMYQDTDSDQWIKASTSTAFGTSGGDAKAYTTETPPPATAGGQLWFKADTGAMYVYYMESATASPSNQWVQVSTGVIESGSQIKEYAILQEQQASGTDGGAFTAGSWVTRVLNTEVTDSDSIVTLAANEFILDVGTWLIEWSAPAVGVDGHTTRLYNVTDSALVGDGSAAWSDTTSSNITYSTGKVHFNNLSLGPRTLRIEHQCGTSNAGTEGLGKALSLGIETYTTVTINKEG